MQPERLETIVDPWRLNFIARARRRNGMFLEMKATAYGVSNVRLLVGFNF